MSNVKLIGCSLVALILPAFVGSAAAQSTARPLTMKQLKPNVWVGLGGAGGNSTVIIGNTSVIVVDAKGTDAGAKALLAEIAKITPKPVKTVVLTNSDADHVNGLGAFPPNLRIIAHLDVKEELQAAQKAGGPGAPPAGRLPTEIVGFYDMGQGMGKEENKPDTIDGVALEMCHWASAHTGADMAVFLPGDKIIAIGDIVVTDRADDNPNIIFEKHGATLGWIDTIKALLRLDADTFITGHGDLVTKADLQRKLDATVARREKVAAMVKEGKSLAAIKAALPDAPAPGSAPAATGGAAMAGGAGAPKTFVEMVYAELSKVNPL